MTGLRLFTGFLLCNAFFLVLLFAPYLIK